MADFSTQSLYAACRTLFGPEVDLSVDFLAYLRFEGVKKAFRQRSKEHHPDRFNDSPAAVRRRQGERFDEIKQAYDLLRAFLEVRRQGGWAAATAAFPSSKKTEPPPPPSKHPLPQLPMQFGLYLLYRKRITFRELISALVWQRRQRPRLGELARQWGWLDDRHIEAIIRRRVGHYRPFGEQAVALGLLRPHQLEQLLGYQQSRQQRLGDYFVERGILTSAEIEELVIHLHRHNSAALNRKRP